MKCGLATRQADPETAAEYRTPAEPHVLAKTIRLAFLPLLAASALMLSKPASNAANAACETITEQGNGYATCAFAAQGTDIRTFLADDNGEVFGSLGALSSALNKQGERLAFGMNAGMYHTDLTPVGLYIENSAQRQSLNTRRGPGNFHLQPNGVFYVANGVASVMESRQFAKRRIKASFATQSGPMLVINGALHPRFNEESDSRKVRNGVGICRGGKVIFAISDRAVTFHEFARLFRDRLSCSNALFLDGGSVPVLYAPSISRSDRGRQIGPIVGVVEKKKR